MINLNELKRGWAKWHNNKNLSASDNTLQKVGYICASLKSYRSLKVDPFDFVKGYRYRIYRNGSYNKSNDCHCWHTFLNNLGWFIAGKQ